MTFKYYYCKTQEEVRKHIQSCEGRHMQQVAYSTFHDGLTQICFGCQKIRTTIELISTEKKGGESIVQPGELYLGEHILVDLEKVIKRDFGKKCKGFRWGCSVCQAYLALQILEDLLGNE